MRNLVPSFLLARMAEGMTYGTFDAVVLFVDTSGFTPLTGQLSAQGHDGAEVLAEILLAVFEPLVATVYAYGGYVAGFAGDAFKAVFPGLTEIHYRQALAAAEQIRTHMAGHLSHETRYGHFIFSVRMSIAAGPENDLTRVLSFVLAVQHAVAQPLRAAILSVIPKAIIYPIHSS